MSTTTPMTPEQWRKQLKKFKVPFREINDFALGTSGRDDETGLIFGPLWGVVIHHVGDDGPDDSSRDLIDRGRNDLPGPLAHSGLDDLGVIDMFTWKRANHAGGGDPRVAQAVRLENYKDYPPDTDYHQGSPGAQDGNDGTYGLETYYSGRKPMTKKQYDTAVRWAAAICDFHGWSAKRVIGHKEWSDWKIDPGSVDMKQFRADVQALLDDANAVPKGPKLLTPNITASIKANIAYQKALNKITDPDVRVKAMVRELKLQRKSLREEERKIA